MKALTRESEKARSPTLNNTNERAEDSQMNTVEVKKAAEIELAKAKLAQEKAQLQLDFASKLEAVEAKEKALATGNVPAAAPAAAKPGGKKRGRPAKAPAAAAPAPAATDGAVPQKDKRMKNDTSWKSMILTVLKENPSGLKIEDIIKQVEAKSFKTDGKVGQMVYQTLYRLWKTDKVVERNDQDVYIPKEAVAA
jgi:hypothetical protein